jgi:uracil DNA glycosylase
MTTLRQELRDFLTDWKFDLSESWAAFFDDQEPDLTAIDSALMSDPLAPVIPGRRFAPRAGAPAGAHVFRAFDGVDPAQVSVIIIGQDPYPKVSRATGRAFEDGSVTAWDASVAVSLQRLMQSAVSLRYGRPDLASSAQGWARIVELAHARIIELESVSSYFDRLQKDHGVLFVNAGWTLTRFAAGGSAEQQAHIAMWRPVMKRLLRGMAERDGLPVVYLLLGGFAKRLFDASGVEQLAVENGKWGVSISSVIHPHPNAQGPSGYLSSGNPMQRVNEVLTSFGAMPVNW